MTNRYSMLQKKLQELEAALIQVLCLPVDTPRHDILDQDIEQRLEFLKNLLSAEVASHPSKPNHLDYISRRLAQLESSFREWDQYRTSAVPVNKNIDVDSRCSCTESCFNDDDTASTESRFGGYEAPENFYEAVMDGEWPEDSSKVAGVKRSGRGWRRSIRNNCLVMVSGMILGAALMLRFNGCSHYTEYYEGFSIPT